MRYFHLVAKNASRLFFLPIDSSPSKIVGLKHELYSSLRYHLVRDHSNAACSQSMIKGPWDGTQRRALHKTAATQLLPNNANRQSAWYDRREHAVEEPLIYITKRRHHDNPSTSGETGLTKKSTSVGQKDSHTVEAIVGREAAASAQGESTTTTVKKGPGQTTSREQRSDLSPGRVVDLRSGHNDAAAERSGIAGVDSEKAGKDFETSNNGRSLGSNVVDVAHNPSDIPVKRVVLKVLALLWPQGQPKIKLLVVMSMICVLAAKVLKVAVPFWFKSVIDILTTNVSAATALPTLGTFSVGVFGCVTAYGLCRFMNSLMEELKTALFAPVGGKASTQLAMEMFNKLLKLDLSFHLSRETGVLSKDLDRGSRAFWSLAYALLFLVAPTAFEMVLVCGALNSQAGIQFIGIALTAVFSYLIWTWTVSNWRTRFRRRYNDLESRVGGITVDSLLNYETIKCFGTETYESNRVRANTVKMNRELIKLDQSMALLNFGQQLIFVVAGVLSFYLATCGAIDGTMTVGDLVLTDALLLQLYMPLSFLGMIYREIQTSTQNMQAMISLLDHVPSVVDAVDARPYAYINGTIELRNVTFKYKADSTDALIRNLCLTIPGGKTVAFVGPSGSGKSTILRLIFRFFDPTEGEILFDGQPLRKLQLRSVRSKVGMIAQDTVLFNTSIRYNLSYSRNDARESEIVDISKRVGLHDTILKMPEAYDTSVGERGLKLSGGEKQRVAIARAFLLDPLILLADEATSALDSKTETQIMEMIKIPSKRGRPRTVILIAHRLATVKDADIIYVLDGKGGLGEQGTHNELLQSGGLYADLWYQQLRNRQSPSQAHTSPH